MQEISTINSMEQIFHRILTVLPRYTDTPKFSTFKTHADYSLNPAQCSYDFTTDTVTLKTQNTISQEHLAIPHFTTTGIKIKNNISKIEWASQYSIKVFFNAPIIRKRASLDKSESIDTIELTGITTEPALNTVYILANNNDLLDLQTAILTLKNISYQTNIAEFPAITNEGFTLNEFDFGFNGLQQINTVKTNTTFTYKTGKPILNSYVIDFTNAKLLICTNYHSHSSPVVLDNTIVGKTASFTLQPSPLFLQTGRNEKSQNSDALETSQQEGGSAILAQNIVRYNLVVAVQKRNDNPSAGGLYFIDEFHKLSLLIQREIAGLNMKFENDDFYPMKSRLALNNSPQFLESSNIPSHYVMIYEFAFSYGAFLTNWCYDNFNDYGFEVKQINIKTSKGEEYNVQV